MQIQGLGGTSPSWLLQPYEAGVEHQTGIAIAKGNDNAISAVQGLGTLVFAGGAFLFV
jgi:hypothetical protein